MAILVTGGLGFIGSHTVVELLKNDYEVVIADNLVNAKIEILDKLFEITGQKIPFYQVDVTQEKELEELFIKYDFDGVIHFAGHKAVGESVAKPLKYYYNNLLSTITVSELCSKYNVSKFVFSSFATVYGDQPSPLSEAAELKMTTNPYGETKVMCERILSDVAKINSAFSVALLRYFNPIGAHESGLIGESPNGIPNNLLPYVTKVAKGELESVQIFGNDYDTVDGTGVRDYIHVVDLAKGHVKALENMGTGVNIYNLGTGRGTSVLEIVNAFKKVNDIEIPYEIVARRSGDIATCFADPSKAKNELKWEAEFDIEDMVRDAWRFEKNFEAK